MKLVDGWRGAWRWFSMQALAVLALAPVVWATLPPDVRAWVPQDWQPWLLVAIAVGGIAGRLIDQNGARANGTQAP
jgi:hypothetical protein